MNFNNQHPSDEIIDRELQALRKPAESHRMSDAVMAMKAQPGPAKTKVNPWALRLGTVSLAAAGIFAALSLNAPKAYALDLSEIASAFKQHPARYMKAYNFSGNKKPIFTTELWTEKNNQKFLQFRDGGLEAAEVTDGKLRRHYWRGDSSQGSLPSASIDLDTGSPFPIETIDTMLNSEFFKKRKIVKTSGVMLNGKRYDYYDFANGYYRLWVDPATKLPAQREIYDKGKTLWERDVYEYSAGFSPDTFKAPEIAGVTYFDYPAMRTKLETTLAGSGTTQVVDGVKVTLKAIVKDRQSLIVLFHSNGDQGEFNDPRRLPIPDIRFYTGNMKDDEITLAKPSNLKNERMFFSHGTALDRLETIKLGVWRKDKFVGYAEFPLKDVFEVPFAGNLLRKPIPGKQEVAQAVSAGK